MYTEREKAQQVNAERYPNTFPRFPWRTSKPSEPTPKDRSDREE